MHRLDQIFRPFHITTTQYNVLRIVRGAGKDGISQCDIAGRMVTETPDVPRLLRRLETAHLISRKVHAVDRRVHTVLLTETGVDLLLRMDAVLREAHGTLLPRLSHARLTALNRLLNAAR